MARKRKRRRGNAADAEQETQRLLTEALRVQARMLAIIEQGGRRRSRSLSRRAAGSVPRAVLTPRVEAEQKRAPFPPTPPQYLIPTQYLQPPPPPPPEPEDFGQVEEPITAADARLVRLFAETLRAMGQEHACV